MSLTELRSLPAEPKDLFAVLDAAFEVVALLTAGEFARACSIKPSAAIASSASLAHVDAPIDDDLAGESKSRVRSRDAGLVPQRHD